MTKPFELGKTYRTLSGTKVTITSLGEQQKGYECVQGDDGIWRYNREGKFERGRVTGSDHTFTHQLNLIPINDDGREAQVGIVETENPTIPINGISLLTPMPDAIQVPTIVQGQPDIYILVYAAEGNPRHAYAKADLVRFDPKDRRDAAALLAEAALEDETHDVVITFKKDNGDTYTVDVPIKARHVSDSYEISKLVDAEKRKQGNHVVQHVLRKRKLTPDKQVG